ENAAPSRVRDRPLRGRALRGERGRQRDRRPRARRGAHGRRRPLPAPRKLQPEPGPGTQAPRVRIAISALARGSPFAGAAPLFIELGGAGGAPPRPPAVACLSFSFPAAPFLARPPL